MRHHSELLERGLLFMEALDPRFVRCLDDMEVLSLYKIVAAHAQLRRSITIRSSIQDPRTCSMKSTKSTFIA